jgi:hypothetical protein
VFKVENLSVRFVPDDTSRATQLHAQIDILVVSRRIASVEATYLEKEGPINEERCSGAVVHPTRIGEFRPGRIGPAAVSRG